MDEHSKLARIAIDVPPGADAAFGVNVSKMRVTLPAEIRPELGAIASGVVSRAQEAYRKRVRLIDGEGRPERGAEVTGDAWSEGSTWHLADQWPLIVTVLERELHEHPQLLQRTLLALANAHDQAPLRAAAAEP